MMMLCGCILRSGLVMRMPGGMIMAAIGVHLARTVMVLLREHDRLQVIAKARRGTAAPGKGRCRREDAEQIGEGDEPPHPDPH